jgi:hypothetical protein
MRRIDADSISQQQLAGTTRNEPVISYVEQLSNFTSNVVIRAAKTVSAPDRQQNVCVSVAVARPRSDIGMLPFLAGRLLLGDSGC